MPGNTENLPKILFIPRWYPHRNDAMEGLFIRQMAEALSTLAELTVLFVCPEPHSPNRFELEYSREHSVDVIRVYYRPGSNFLQKISRFYIAHRRGLELLQGYRPDLVHAHIFTRHALMGYLLAKRFHVPCIISEHWSRFFRINPSYPGWLQRHLMQFLASGASGIVAVSGMLKEAMENAGITHEEFRVVPNPVNMDRFIVKTETLADPVRHFVHISCFDDRSKNISGLLQAVKTLAGRRTDFVCHLVGEGPDLEKMKRFAEQLGITPGRVVFEGLKDGDELPEFLAKSDFSVLSSRYETFATVIIESLACGVPVLSTRVGIAPEVVNETTGILVPSGDQEAFVQGLDTMLDRCRSYDRLLIRGQVSLKFSSGTVAQEMMSVYERYIHRD